MIHSPAPVGGTERSAHPFVTPALSVLECAAQTPLKSARPMTEKHGMPANPLRVGYIGVGLMGHGAAKNILLNGYPVRILGHRNRTAVDDLLARGAVFGQMLGVKAENSGSTNSPEKIADISIVGIDSDLVATSHLI